MFERYTESARRTIFLARHQACIASAQQIGTVDLLQGIIRESKPEAYEIEWIRSNWERICEALRKNRTSEQQEQSSARDIKLSRDAKSALLFAAEVGYDNPGSIIDTPTLFLGLLSFQNDATSLLERLGLDLEGARKEVRKLHQNYPPELPRRSVSLRERWRWHRMTILRGLIAFIAVGSAMALINLMRR